MGKWANGQNAPALLSAGSKKLCGLCGSIFLLENLICYICSMQHVEQDLQVRWLKLRIKLKDHFGIKPDMNGVLLLIGVQELGQGPQDFSKEQKQDLMHIAICTILQASGFYSHDGLDDEGWPHFTQLKALPELYLDDQENFLKDHVLLYFQTQGFI